MSFLESWKVVNETESWGGRGNVVASETRNGASHRKYEKQQQCATTHSDDKECLCSAWGGILDGVPPSNSSVSGWRDIKHDVSKQTSADTYMNYAVTENMPVSVIAVLDHAFRQDKYSNLICQHMSTAPHIKWSYSFGSQLFPISDHIFTWARGGVTVRGCCSLKNLLMKSCSARHSGSSSLRTCSNICKKRHPPYNLSMWTHTVLFLFHI